MNYAIRSPSHHRNLCHYREGEWKSQMSFLINTTTRSSNITQITQFRFFFLFHRSPKLKIATRGKCLTPSGGEKLFPKLFPPGDGDAEWTSQKFSRPINIGELCFWVVKRVVQGLVQSYTCQARWRKMNLVMEMCTWWKPINYRWKFFSWHDIPVRGDMWRKCEFVRFCWIKFADWIADWFVLNRNEI